MPSEGPINRLPSGMIARGGDGAKASAPAYSSGEPPSAVGALPILVSLLALLLAMVSLYISLTTPHGLGAQERLEIKSIAASLREVQQKDIVLTSQPLRTTVYVEKNFPVSDILPDSFGLPLDLTIPLDEQVTAQSASGQLVPLRLNTTLRVRAVVPLDVAKASEGVQVSIHKEIPLETKFSTNLRISAVYGQEFNTLIQRLDALAQGPTAPN